MGLYGGTDLEGNLNEGFASPFFYMLEKTGRHAAGLGHLDRLALEHRGHLKKVSLGGVVIGGVVAAGAFHLDSEKSRADDVSLGRHGQVVLRGFSESGGSSIPGASAHHDQFGGETVHRLVVFQCIEDPVSKGTGVVQVGLEKVGIFGEGILPIANPVVRPSILPEDSVDHLCPLVGGGVRLKGAYHLEWGSYAQSIYPNPPEKSKVIGDGSSFGNFLRFLVQFPAPEDPFF